jgi:hypothetical protein
MMGDGLWAARRVCGNLFTSPPAEIYWRAVADVAELADAPDSKSGTRESVWVRPPPSAPSKSTTLWGCSKTRPQRAVVLEKSSSEVIRLYQPLLAGSGQFYSPASQ